MTRDLKKEQLIINVNKIREEGIKSAPTLVNMNYKRIGILVITDIYANTTKEINVAKLNKEQLLQKIIDTHHEMFAVEVHYIQEKNLVDGPYLSLSWKAKPSILDFTRPARFKLF